MYCYSLSHCLTLKLKVFRSLEWCGYLHCKYIGVDKHSCICCVSFLITVPQPNLQSRGWCSVSASSPTKLRPIASCFSKFLTVDICSESKKKSYQFKNSGCIPIFKWLGGSTKQAAKVYRNSSRMPGHNRAPLFKSTRPLDHINKQIKSLLQLHHFYFENMTNNCKQ